MSELSAQILLSALPSVSPLSLQHHVLLSQKCWSKKAVFYFCLCYTCEEILCLVGIFLAYFHFDSVCNCVCVVCAVVLFWTLFALLPQVSLFFFFFNFIIFRLCSLAEFLSFVIRIILLDNFLWLFLLCFALSRVDPSSCKHSYSILYSEESGIWVVVLFLLGNYLLFKLQDFFFVFFNLRWGSMYGVVSFGKSPLTILFYLILFFLPSSMLHLY